MRRLAEVSRLPGLASVNQWQRFNNRIALDDTLNDTERRILLFILTNGKNYGWAAKSDPDDNVTKSLACVLGLNYEVTRANVKRLIRKGYLAREVRRGHEEIVITEEKRQDGGLQWVKECRMYLGYDRWAAFTNEGRDDKVGMHTLLHRYEDLYAKDYGDDAPFLYDDDGGSTQSRKDRWKRVFKEVL